MKQQIVTALDIGSSNVRVVIAVGSKNGEIEIKGIGETAVDGMDKGIVKDIEAVSSCLKTAFAEAEQNAKCKAQNIYANISGEHIKTHESIGRISIPGSHTNEPGEILPEHVEQVIEDAKKSLKIQKGFERLRILHGIPQSFEIDGQGDIRNPVNMNGFHLTAHVLSVFADINTLRNLTKCIELAGYQIEPENFILNHLAVAQAVLTDDEKNLGCLLMDFGGGTCDLALYNKGAILKLIVIPMAGNAISRDLAIGLKTTVANAELIKSEYGVAIADRTEKEKVVNVDGISGRTGVTKSQYLISQIIQHRLDDILALCYNEAVTIVPTELITAGVVLTGGIANLKEIDSLIAETFNMPVKPAKPDVSGFSGSTLRLEDHAFATVVGLLRFGFEAGQSGKSSTTRIRTGTNINLIEKTKKFIKDIVS
ncbi:MAG: cell division protein FtsA [Candidatus Cloacimonetes bacterium]|nr:cell division protein FtsA [Candidatus Cloacimonadota bacterium]